jgi:primosomal protein N' (replication factor Y)
MYVEVAIDLPLAGTFTYLLPEGSHVAPGARVLVPWSSSFRTGVAVELHERAVENADAVRPIAEVLDQDAFVPAAQLALALWASRYYASPIGECVRLALPAGALVGGDAEVRLSDGQTPTASWQQTLMLVGSMPLAELTGSQGVRFADVFAAERRGEVAIEVAQTHQRVREKTTDEFSRTAAERPARLGPAQVRILDYLEAWGPTLWDELKENAEAGRGSVKSLVDRGLVEAKSIRLFRNPLDAVASVPRGDDPTLSEAQQAAVSGGMVSLHAARPRPILLHGVTGSGKTEVYIRLARIALAQGRRVLVLLPEIALTPQFVGVFRSVFGDDVAVQHSGMNAGQRYDQWQRIRAGSVSIIIGARSALFAPVGELGLVIVDEEHDPSFKQDTGVPYNARDLAVVLAHTTKATLVLGSATPSLESWVNVERERYSLLSLPDRVAGRPQPRIELLDMRDNPPSDDDPASHLISPRLQKEVRDNALQGEQTILFLNRRGFAPVVSCRNCQEKLSCSDCNVTLTYHQRGDRLKCHWCGFGMRKPTACPTCGSDELQTDGAGTEQLEDLVAGAFEGLRVLRLDADTSRTRGLHSVLDRFRAGDADVLVGTQMVTKGHDFPAVTLVGVVNADQSLRFPDFRSGERTFQLLTQVAGRAGRAERPGRVLIQTWDPDHFVLQAVLRGDLEGWKQVETNYRERNVYPPYGSMALLRCSGVDYQPTLHWAQRLVDTCRRTVGDRELRWVGPVDAPLTRLRGRFRIHTLVRGPDRTTVQRAVHALVALIREWNGDLRKAKVRADVDVDPQALL